MDFHVLAKLAKPSKKIVGLGKCLPILAYKNIVNHFPMNRRKEVK